MMCCCNDANDLFIKRSLLVWSEIMRASNDFDKRPSYYHATSNPYICELLRINVASIELIGCSGWKYDDPIEKGGWIDVFYPDAKTRFLNYYSRFFNTAEFDAVFYEKLYRNEVSNKVAIYKKRGHAKRL